MGAEAVGTARREVPIDTLTSKQRAHLRALAHGLKPVAQVGGDGVSDQFLDALREAFNTRELLKVKVLEGAPLDAGTAASEIARGLPAAGIAQVIGRTIVVYHPFPEDPEIRLPG
jgi:RNA-binding protein